MFDIEEKLILWAAATAVIIIGIWTYGHSRYSAGERDAEAHMQALVDKAKEASIRKETAAQARVDTLETENEARLADADTRLAAAVSRYERLRAQSPRRSAAPETASAPAVSDGNPNRPGPAGGDGGLDAIMADADRLARRTLAAGGDAEQLRVGLGTLQQYGAEMTKFRADIDRLNSAR